MFLSFSRRRCSLRAAQLAVALVAFTGLSAFAQLNVDGRPLSLARAVEVATERSRLVAAADAQTQAAREIAVTADRLPDPVLKLGINNLPVDGPDRFSVTRDFMTMRSVGVMQEWTHRDKRQARAGRAEREIEAARIGRRSIVAELQRDAALAWLDRSFQESMRELLRSQISQSELQEQAAETAYRGGKGSQADVYAARAATEQLRDALAQTDRMIAVATTQLGRWLGADAATSLGERPVFAAPEWTRGDFLAHLQQHPQIAAATQQEALAESDAAVARAGQRADWNVELMFSQRGSAYSNMVSLNLSVPLQWDQRHRQDRELAARLAGIEQARARREDLRRAHEAEVRTMLQEWASFDERLRRYDGALLPLAGQRSEAALAAYRAGTGTLSAVLEARKSQLDIRMERLRIEAERARAWAQLNYLLPAQAHANSAVEAAR